MKKRADINMGMPEGWRWLNGAWRYRVPVAVRHLWDNRQTFTLGKSLSEAWGEWTKRVDVSGDVHTVGQLLDRYAMEGMTENAPKTKTDKLYYIKELKGVFGKQPIAHIQPKDVYGYYNARTAKVAAKREIALLRHAFTMAVQWGLINAHPFKWELELKGEKPRTRLVTQDEIVVVLSLEPTRDGNEATPMLQAYIRLKLMLGLRRGDMLRLGDANWTDKGLLVPINKTGDEVIYTRTDALEQAWAAAKACRHAAIAPWLFCTRRGKPYLDEAKGTAHAFNSIWQRFMARVEKAGVERFHEHDLRAVVASNAESLEHARQLMTHSSANTTNRIYRRGPEKVSPLK